MTTWCNGLNTIPTIFYDYIKSVGLSLRYPIEYINFISIDYDLEDGDLQMSGENEDISIPDIEEVFTTDDYLYFYEDKLTEERTENEVEFLEEQLELEEGMKILDLACGIGRHANLLSERGYEVTGVDITSDFLEIAEEESEERGVDVDYIEEDMREISYEEEFDRIILVYTSFGYFDDEENLQVLENVSEALKPGGLFCFDTLNRDVFLKHFSPYVVKEKGNDMMIDRNEFDFATGRWENKRIVIKDGEKIEKPFTIRLYSLTEIIDLLDEAGFEIYNTFGDWDGTSLSEDSRRMIIIAKKREQDLK